MPTNQLGEWSLAATLRFKPHLSTVTRTRVRGNIRYSRPLLAKKKNIQRKRESCNGYKGIVKGRSDNKSDRQTER
jgi:hypothetical protein